MGILIEIIGALGLIQILLAFLLLQRRKITDDHHLYNILNLVGSACIAIYSASYKAWFSVILNVVWFVIAGVDLISNLKGKK